MPWSSVLAHSSVGLGDLGASPALLAFALVALVVLVVAARRVAPLAATPAATPTAARTTVPSWTGPAAQARVEPARIQPEEGPGAEGAWPLDGASPAVRAVAQGVGLAGLVGALVVAWFGSHQVGANPIALLLFTGGLLAAPVATLLVGDVWRLVNPFDAVAGWLEQVRGQGPGTDPDPVALEANEAEDSEVEDDEADWWVPSLGVLSLQVMSLGLADGYRPRWLAAWLTAYTAAMVVGALVGGRAWVRRNEGFAVLLGALARLAPVGWRAGRPHLRRPGAGLVGARGGHRVGGVLVVLLGAIVFDAVSARAWWAELIGRQSRDAYSVIETAGLVWTVVLLGALLLALAAVAARTVPVDEPRERAVDLALALVPLAAGLVVANDLTTILTDGTDLLALLGDPMAQGWDLLGTSGWRSSDEPIPATTSAVIQVAALGAGVVAAAGASVSLAVDRWGRASLDRAAWVLAAAFSGVGVAAGALLLGG